METNHRPRAGTMPSLALSPLPARSGALQQQSQPSAVNPNHLRMPPPHHFASQPPSPAAKAEAPATASAAGQPPSNRNANRSRSGSLTLPPPIPTPGSNTAFSGFFSGPWTPAAVNPHHPTASESVRSDESSAAGAEDHLVRTLDYLGLQDPSSTSAGLSSNSPPPQASSRDLAGSRNRANTLAAPPIRRRPSAHLLNNPLDSLPEAQSPPQEALQPPETPATAHNGTPLFPSVVSSRPRASTGLPLEPVVLSSRKRAGTTSLLHATTAAAAAGHGHHRHALSQSHNSYPDDTTASSSDESIGYHQANLSSASSIQLAGSGANSPSNRSLWVGNLPPQTSLADLYATFGVYGPVESVRFVPERSYAVINYTSSQLAVDAKHDIVDRLHGLLWGVPVRLAYGSESSPISSPEQQQHHHRRSVQPSPVPDEPSRVIRIGPLPASITAADVTALLSPLAAVEQVQLAPGQPRAAVVLLPDTESAFRIAVTLGGKEIFGPDFGYCKITFLRPGEDGLGLTAATDGTLESLSRSMPASLNRQTMAANQALQAAAMMSASQGAASMPAAPAPLMPAVSADSRATPSPPLHELQDLLRDLSGPSDPDVDQHVQQLAQCSPPVPYFSNIMPPHTDQHGPRKKNLEAPYLRDLRKRLDSGVMYGNEVDAVAESVMDDAAFLASDYIGNTIIQKFFEKCSAPVKLALLQRIAPHLASIGINKHGTWAAQRIIDVAQTPQEVSLICKSLMPYIPPLLLDQYGNYVVQCTLRFASPVTDGIFDAMFARCWDIAHGRFGARSMRTVLESPYVDRFQQKRMALAFINNAVALSMNSNGALLLTWLLETSDFRGRYALLTSRLLPHLPMLCSHKVASNTILRIVNQRHDITAQQSIISAVFDDQAVILEQLLLDQTHGLSMVQRMLASTHIEQSQRAALVARVRTLLVNINIDSGPSFTRILSDLAAGNIASAQPSRASPNPRRGGPTGGPSAGGKPRPEDFAAASALQASPWSGAHLAPAQFVPYMAAPPMPVRGMPVSTAAASGATTGYGLAPAFPNGQPRRSPTSRSPRPQGDSGASLPTSIVPPAYANPNGLPFVSDYDQASFASTYK